MKKLLLFALLLSGMVCAAQPNIVDGNCKAYFKYEVNDKLMSPIAATVINFYDESEVAAAGAKIAWWWDFGDGDTSQEQNPVHIFMLPVPGPNVKINPYKTITLTILTSDSCKSSYSETINIVDGTIGVPPSACKAIFKYYQAAYDSIGGTTTYQLNNYSEGDSLSYFWQFDNGSTSTDKEPVVTFDIKPVNHHVCLTVSGTNGCSDTFCDELYFSDPNIPVIDPILCNTAFGYSVNYTIQTFAPALVLDFYSKASPDAVEWNWDFDDGGTSSEQNPTHIFNFPLTNDSILADPNPFRKVCLTVKTATGCMSSYCETINIYMNSTPPVEPPVKACVARYKYYQTELDSVAGKVTFQFNNYSEGDSLSYLWFFDNGITSTEKEPVETFDLKQLPLKASLTIAGKNNCTDTFWDAVYPDGSIVYPDSTQCNASFGYTVNYTVETFAPALVLDFNAKSSPDATVWNWDFGDGSTSSEQNPTHVFNLPLANTDVAIDQIPYRNVCLSVTTVSGCVANYCETIDLYQKGIPPVDTARQCQAWFKYERATDLTSIPEVVPYRLKDVSEGKITSRLWQFEDGTTSTEAEPVVSFDFQKPTQKVCLTIFTDSCSDTHCETINVSEIKPDTIIPVYPEVRYAMHYTSYYPPQMSSCGGYVKAEVYLNDTLIQADDFAWSNGDVGQEVNDLCPTQLYTVKATTVDGTIVSGTFVFNSDGTVTEAPYNWWVTGVKDNPLLRDNIYNNNYTTEWKLCDGTIILSDSIPRNSPNCENEDITLILKDASGNVLYTEPISTKDIAVGLTPKQNSANSIKVYPNPAKDVLNIQYSGKSLNEMQVQIFDVSGKSVSAQKIHQVETGQTISLNVNLLKKGMYVCKVISGTQLIGTSKFSK